MAPHNRPRILRSSCARGPIGRIHYGFRAGSSVRQQTTFGSFRAKIVGRFPWHKACLFCLAWTTFRHRQGTILRPVVHEDDFPFPPDLLELAQEGPQPPIELRDDRLLVEHRDDQGECGTLHVRHTLQRSPGLGAQAASRQTGAPRSRCRVAVPRERFSLKDSGRTWTLAVEAIEDEGPGRSRRSLRRSLR